METKTLIIVIVGIVAVLAIIPFVPKILKGLETPDPAMDAPNLARIQEAVEAHREYLGLIPQTLTALVPKYIASIPKTYDGRAFAYDNQTGTVSMPAKPGSATEAVSGGGIPASVDAFTGLSVREELNF
jgi:hypothetical protein